MNSRVEANIIEYLAMHSQARVDELQKELGFSKSIIHRYLLKLLTQGKVKKVGVPPVVYYMQVKSRAAARPDGILMVSDLGANKDTHQFIEQNYVYVAPNGEQYIGVEGFQQWLTDTDQQYSNQIAQEYVNAMQNAARLVGEDGYIDATFKLESSFDDLKLEKVFYSDFYSLPKFGKTKLGQLVLNAKQSQSVALTRQVAKVIKPHLESIISKYQIEAVAFVPHSIPRQMQFLHELRKQLSLLIPEIKIDKVFPSEIIVAQKSLPKLEQRIQNAQDTIFIRNNSQKYGRVLIIDDLVGSGATINETAKKILLKNMATRVYAYAVVGSYKEFEVVPML